MARADTLQAGLRSNPIFIRTVSSCNTGQPFSRAGPGGPQQFDTNVTYPLDVSHKRQARRSWWRPAPSMSWKRCTRMPSASGSTTSTTHSSRPWPRARRCDMRKRASRGWRSSPTASERLFNKGGDQSRSTSTGSRIQLRTTRLGLVDAEATYRKAKLDLGSLMNLTLDEIARLELRGQYPGRGPATAVRSRSFEAIALADRPDVARVSPGRPAGRRRRSAGRANAFSDVYRPLAALYLSGQHSLRA